MKKSHQLFEKAKQIIPGGVQNARHPSNFTEAYPIFMESAKGSHVWDVDGHEYVDWLLSYGPIILGHCNDEVDEYVHKVTRKGMCLDLTTPMQLTLCEKLIEHIPSAEMVLCVMTGSEATSAAVRIARVYTGKDMIIRWGYHGWHDWCLDNHNGIPQALYELVKTFRYNDLSSLEEVLEKNKDRAACIIMMPFEVVSPEPGFLEGVRELADRYKVVLIFDEIRSWPRMGLGGAQKHFGVTPDITTLSKGIANGYPFSAVVGKAEVMEAAKKTVISATYFPSRLGMAAALETIRQLEDGKALEHITNIAKKLGDGLSKLVENRKVKAAVFGVPQMPFLMFGDKEANTITLNSLSMATSAISGGAKGNNGDKESDKSKILAEMFYSETIKRGIFFHPKHHWFSCLAHTEEDVKKSLEASEEALDIALKSI